MMGNKMGILEGRFGLCFKFGNRMLGKEEVFLYS